MKSNINHPQPLAINAELNQVHLTNNRSRKLAGSTVAYKIGSAIYWLSYNLSPAQKRKLLLSVLVLLSSYFIFVLLNGITSQENKPESKVKQSLPINPAK